jgi:hypothetical protein
VKSHAQCLREALLRVAGKVGFDGAGRDGLDGWLMRLAIEEPVTFAMLLKSACAAIEPHEPREIVESPRDELARRLSGIFSRMADEGGVVSLGSNLLPAPDPPSTTLPQSNHPAIGQEEVAPVPRLRVVRPEREGERLMAAQAQCGRRFN